MNLFNKQKNNGFTLVELMVASTLFTIIMMMGVGSLVVSSNSSKSSQKLRTAVDNVSFAMESMTRELRTGTLYFCTNGGDIGITQDCVNGNIIIFTPQQTPGAPARVFYKLHDREEDTTFSLQRCENTDANCVDVVSGEVDIQILKFYVTGSSTGDFIQPSIKIIIKGVVTIKGVGNPFTLQTMVSQRSTDQV
jgi:prepilin-type N-terminal cleavage/methylation domain-containing protein